MNFDNISKDGIMLMIVAAVLLFAGYELAHRPDGETAKTLLGAILVTFGLITNRLFGGPPSAPGPPSGA